MRDMVMVGFLQAQNCSNFAGSWRHPDSRSDFASPDFYAHIGRVLEAGKFQLAFFDDRLGMPEFHGGRFAEAVAHGIRCVKMDPIACLMPMAMATSRLGLGATYSTTYYHPFHVARLFQTLDLMTRGRAAWNVVTSMNDVEAQNMGLEEVLEHDARYDRADEFMQVVHGHWDSWADDALIIDKSSGRFADPEKVRRLNHDGRHFRSRGPFTVPRSPQGHPVIIQAGQSGRGRRFAARWGELIFVSNPNLGPAKVTYAELKADAASHGRDPDHMKIATLCHPVVAATRAEAEDKLRFDRAAATRGRLADAAVGGNQFRFRRKAARRAVHRRRTRPLHRHAVGSRPGRRGAWRQEADAARFHHHHAARQTAAALGRRRQGCCGPVRGMVCGACLRRLRRRCRLCTGELCGLRRPGDPGAPAPPAFPEGI